ncbi:MAG: hypothetical protein AAGB48_03995 [Planctomycetota bacterium]
MEPQPSPTQLPPAFTTRTPYDRTGIVQESIPCCRCGYDLRGLDIKAICPECGESVARSVVGDLLEFMPAERIRRLHRILGGITLGTYLSVLLPIFGSILAGFAVGLTGSPAAMATVMFVILAFGLVVLAKYWWALSSLDGDLSETALAKSAKRACVLMIIGYLAWMLQSLLGGFSPWTSFRQLVVPVGPQPGAAAIPWTLVLSWLLFPIWIGFSGAYFWNAQHALSFIARKAPDALIEHRARSRRLSSVLWWSIGWLALFLGPLVAISNLTTTIKDCRFHTKRALSIAQARGLADAEIAANPKSPDSPHT